MFKIALLACAVALCSCQSTTKHPHGHTHKPHHEGATIQFRYETNGELVMKTGSHCYVWMLNAAQQTDVHDKLKMEILEFELAGHAKDVGNQTVFTPVNDHWIDSHCHKQIIVKVAGQ